MRSYDINGYTVDLYTNIDLKDAIKLIDEFLREKFQSKHIIIFGAIKLKRLF